MKKNKEKQKPLKQVPLDSKMRAIAMDGIARVNQAAGHLKQEQIALANSISVLGRMLGIDNKLYEFDLNKLTFIPKPKAPQPAPTPEATPVPKA